MKNEIIDISIPLHPDMVTWPESEGFKLIRNKNLEEGDEVNNSLMISDVHIGTHIDAPLHHISNGASVDQLNLDFLIGPAYVVDLIDENSISVNVLNTIHLPKDIKRILFRTKNSELWHKKVKEFSPSFVGLEPDAAQWIVNRGIFLIGIDYLSIQKYTDNSQTHQILLNSGVIIIEGLNLFNIQTGIFELICLPINIAGSEGAPARAVLRKSI